MEEKELGQELGIIGQELGRLLDANDVAKILKISVKTVQKRVREGKLGCVQVTPKHRRFTRKQVQAFIEAQSTEVQIDRVTAKAVTSPQPKGGEEQRKAKSFEAQVTGSLVEELKALCR